MRKHIKTLLFGLFAIGSGTLIGCDSETSPEPKNIYEEAVYSSMRFDGDDEQDKGRKPAEVLEFSTVASGMVVADLSAGTGYYTELLSYIVGKDGKVYLHNKPDYFAREEKKAAIDERLYKQRLANVSLVSSPFDALSLPSKVDGMFISKIFHDFYLSKDGSRNEKVVDAFFREISQYLKKDGFILLIDHSAAKGSNTSTTPKMHRIDEDFVKQVFESHGFELVSSSDVLRNGSDSRNKNIWDGSISKKTDRFVYLFRKK